MKYAPELISTSELNKIITEVEALMSNEVPKRAGVMVSQASDLPMAFSFAKLAASGLDPCTSFVASVTSQSVFNTFSPFIIPASLADLHPLYKVSANLASLSEYTGESFNSSVDGLSGMDSDLLRSYLRIAEIEKLKDNWAGDGTARFSSHILNTLRDIVKDLPRQPDIFPTARESIQFEYEDSLGNYLEFELFEDDRLKMFFCGHNGDTRTKMISSNMVGEAVRRFYELNN